MKLVTLPLFISVVTSILLDSVWAGGISVWYICLWDTDKTVEKGCMVFDYSSSVTKTVCRPVDDYEIAYEAVLYHTAGGYGPCEPDSPDTPCYGLIKSVYLKICNENGRCQDRTERVWPYFSFGNVLDQNLVHGRDYAPGVYHISTQIRAVDPSLSFIDQEMRTMSFELRPECLGDEDLVLQ